VREKRGVTPVQSFSEQPDHNISTLKDIGIILLSSRLLFAGDSNVVYIVFRDGLTFLKYIEIDE